MPWLSWEVSGRLCPFSWPIIAPSVQGQIITFEAYLQEAIDTSLYFVDITFTEDKELKVKILSRLYLGSLLLYLTGFILWNIGGSHLLLKGRVTTDQERRIVCT